MTHSSDFLSHEEHARIPGRHRVWVQRGAIVLLSLVVAYGLLAAFGAGRVLAASLDAKDALGKAEAAAMDLDFATTELQLETAAKDIAKAKTGLLVLGPLRPLPYLGDQVRAVDAVLTASERLLPSLERAVEIAANIVEVVKRAEELSDLPLDKTTTYLTLPSSVRHDLLTRLHQSEPALQEIRSQLTLAEKDLNGLSALRLADPIAQAVAPFTTLVPELRRTVDVLVPLSQILPEFAGLDAPKQFLLLFENNSELRPGGGFISTYGTLTVQDGAVSSLTTRDSYAADGPATGLINTNSPEPLRRYTGVQGWYFRDANWSPDFAVSSAKAMELLAAEEVANEQPATVYDGTIALTPTLAAGLLALTGPITIDGQTFTTDNVIDSLEYQVEVGFAEQGIPAPQRKEVLSTLTQVVIDRLFHLPLAAWAQVADTLLTGIEQKQFFLQSAEASVEQELIDAGWAGVVTPPPRDEDSLMVVDANLASLKSDPEVERTIDYRLRQNDQGRLVAQVNITYTHHGDFNWKTTRYRTYTRLYAPLGSTLIRGDGMLANDKILDPAMTPGVVDVGTDLGFTTFGAFISIEPGTSGTLSFSYYLPDTLAEAVRTGTYKLEAIKQLGAQNNALTVDVDFGKPLLSATPSEDQKDFGDTQYLLNTIFDQDREVVVRF